MVLRNLDLALLVVALPVFVLAGWPLVGYAVACVAWLAQRQLGRVLDRRAQTSGDPKAVVGLVAGGSIARGWFSALCVLVVGLFDNRAGLSAAILLLLLFTIYFATKLAQRGGSAA